MANAYSVTGKADTMSDYKIEIKNLYKIFGPNDKRMVDLVANGTVSYTHLTLPTILLV